jgi:hypothetical protein
MTKRNEPKWTRKSPSKALATKPKPKPKAKPKLREPEDRADLIRRSRAIVRAENGNWIYGVPTKKGHYLCSEMHPNKSPESIYSKTLLTEHPYEGTSQNKFWYIFIGTTFELVMMPEKPKVFLLMVHQKDPNARWVGNMSDESTKLLKQGWKIMAERYVE